MRTSSIALLLLISSAASLMGQDGVLVEQGEYYSPANRSGYPFLSGRVRTYPVSEHVTVSGPAMNCNTCCSPLLPTVAQGIRDTINALLPCRGVRRMPGHRLLFSHRFHEGSCCGGVHHHGHEEIILESGDEPTPADSPSESEEVTPEVIDSGVQYRRLPVNSVRSTSTRSVTSVRTVSGESLIRTVPAGDTGVSESHPTNPLRR